MDCTKNGPEQQVTTIPTSKPKPPVARKPTKPIPPRKPTLAAKPTHIISAFQPINGDVEPELSPVSTQPVSQTEVEPASRPTALSSPQQTGPRPKEPPPPLPKSPPRGQVASKTPPPVASKTPPPVDNKPTTPAVSQAPPTVASKTPPPVANKTPPPGVRKTPPPLPKTPPRGGSIKSHSRKPLTAQTSFDADSSASTPSPSSGVEPCSEPSKTNLSPVKAFPNTPRTDISICDKPEDTVDGAKSSPVDNTRNESSDDKSVNNLTSQLGGSNEKLVPKPLPKVPVKPKPRSVDRKLSISEKSDEKNDLNDQTKVNGIAKSGNTTWFVAQEETNQVKKEVHVAKDEATDAAIQYKIEKQESVQFYKTQSPVQSPRLPRKPPPRTPSKPSKTFLSKDSTQDTAPVKPGTKDDVIPPNCDNSVQVNISKEIAETFQDKSKQEYSILKDSSAATTDNIRTEDPSKVESPVSNPKPVPRRPAPRPRPAPRKRQSLNRLSSTDETLSGQYLTGSVHNLSDNSGQGVSAKSLSNIKAKSEDSVFLASQGFSLVTKEIDIGDKEDTNSGKRDCAKESELNKNVLKGFDNSDRGSKVTSLKKSRVVYSSKGEEKQYRIIDKTIVKCQVPDVDDSHSSTDVVLRRKDNEEKSPVAEDVIDKTKDIAETASSIQVQPKGIKDTANTAKVNESNKGDKSDTDLNRANNSERNSKSNGSDPDEKAVVNGGLKDSFEDLLSDKSILEPSSLLNEIEEILSRSYKHTSLTRSGSSPEKTYIKSAVERANVRNERSKSVDVGGSTPVRPPRPKKEQKRLRSRSQVAYDSCGSDTESLPDLSRSREDLKSNCSLTLPPAKPHPPKPKRNKLLRVQRSHSDITAMKSVMEKQADRTRSPASSHKRQFSDAGPSPAQDTEAGSPGQGRHMSWRKNRPSRKAPPPPIGPPFKVTPPSPSVDLNTVIPVTNKRNDQKKTGKEKLRQMKQKGGVKETSGSMYSSINDEDVQDSSDGDHDYHYISDDAENYETVTVETKPVGMVKVEPERQGKSSSPPKLPPRNMNNSHSFETSSLSSASHDFDSAITGEAASSIDDLSVSSGCIEPENGLQVNSDIMSPGFKALKHYPMTSSPNVRHRLAPDSDSSEQSGLGVGHGKRSRPVSGASFQSDDGSMMIDTPLSSSESEGEYEDKATRKREKKLFMIAQEIMSSERVFVDVLYLLNVDFRKHISAATEAQGRPVIPNETLNRILDYLPQLQNFNEDLLRDLEDRIKHWEKKQGIADIFKKKGPFLKLYSSYIRDFETMTSTLDEAIKKYPTFQAALKEFEMGSRCSQLALRHYMLKPIQRIPQYRMLLQDYIKHMLPDSPEMKDMQTALAIVSEVAHHANENMRHGDYVQKMLEIQRSLIGQFEVIKPGRIFLKEGELMKLSRKEMQPRYFFMFNDVLLYTTPVATGYRLNNILPLAGMKVSVPAQDDFRTEFNIISVQRSFTLHASSLEEREDWVTALNAAIDENALKRNTFEAVRAGAQVLLDKDFVLGHKAPLWIPDARVTMCMLCTSEFTVTWRRHHCRACGRVVCGNCSENKSPLRYLKYKNARVCEECFKTLLKEDKQAETAAKNHAVKEAEEGNLMDHLSGLFERFQKIRKSGRTEKKPGVVRPDRLKEVNANDEGASMSGYLHRFHKGRKWKRHWYLIKDKVLYTFKATQDTAANDSMVLLGYEVSRFTEYFEGIEPELLFQLSHANTDPIVFRTDSATATEKWVTVMRESIVA